MNLLIDGSPKEIAEFIFELQDISIETTDDIEQLTDKVAAELATKISNLNDRKIDLACDCKKSSDEITDSDVGKCSTEIFEVLKRYPQFKNLQVSTTDTGKRIVLS